MNTRDVQTSAGGTVHRRMVADFSKGHTVIRRKARASFLPSQKALRKAPDKELPNARKGIHRHVGKMSGTHSLKSRVFSRPAARKSRCAGA